MSMNHVMTDVETMGKNPNAPIVAIGAVLFDPVAGELGNQLYVKVNLEDAVRTGGVMDASTVLWWLQQDDAARVELLRERGENLAPALWVFSEFLEPFAAVEPLHVWGNGATFDNVILSTAYERVSLRKPWGYTHDRCFRTLKNLFPGLEPEFIGTPHHALHDALHQAKHALAIAKAHPNLNWS